MRTRLLSLVAIVALAFTLSACAKKETKILTVYYSQWGNTETLANMIHESVGGDLFKIELVNPYPSDGTHAAVQKDIDAGVLPQIKNKVENLDSYDIIFIGTPNWFNSVCLPVKAFLQENDLSGKKIVPFATYGGSAGECLTDIVGLCPHATALKSFAVSGDEVKASKDSVQVRMEEWLKELAIKK